MNVTLIGMTGVGKSSVGKVLAQRLDCDSIDTDTIIEKKAGMSLQTIIDKKGEEVFLSLEEQAVLSLDFSKSCVISTGGSVVYSNKAMDFLKSNSSVVHLKASYEDVDKWVSNRLARGVVGIKNRSLKDIFQERMLLYDKYADHTVILGGNYSVGSVVGGLMKFVYGW